MKCGRFFNTSHSCSLFCKCGMQTTTLRPLVCNSPSRICNGQCSEPGHRGRGVATERRGHSGRGVATERGEAWVGGASSHPTSQVLPLSHRCILALPGGQVPLSCRSFLPGEEAGWPLPLASAMTLGKCSLREHQGSFHLHAASLWGEGLAELPPCAKALRVAFHGRYFLPTPTPRTALCGGYL